MGIPHLQGFLQPYATRVEYTSSATSTGEKHGQHPRRSCFEQDLIAAVAPALQSHLPQSLPCGNTNAIVDGPSLAYHVYNISAAQANIASDGARPATPSYRVILAVLFAWLDALARHGFCIAAIIFDGALPVAKKSVRLNRLASSTKAMQTCRATWKVDDEKHLDASRNHSGSVLQMHDSDLFGVVQRLRKGAKLPAPPFLVPAVIEALVQSSFATVTRVVPGEADPFCAAFARSNGGTIFTSDSDLLVYDLGLSGSVILFKDLEHDSTDASSSLRAQKYELNQIAQRLGLSTLEPFAYAVQEDHHRGFGGCLNRARRLEKGTCPHYGAFLKQYDIGKLDVGPLSSRSPVISEQLSRLDPRISEWVYEVRTLSDSREKCKLDVDMYLPSIIEDPDRASPWKMGADVRRLAYSVLRPKQTKQINTREFFRRGPGISDTVVPHLNCSDIMKAIELSNLHMTRVIAALSSEDVRPSWRELGLFWLCSGLLEDGKSVPPKVELQALLVPDVNRGWGHIHLFAQLQAILYSWRILMQCLSVFQADDAAHGKSCAALSQTIHSIEGCEIPRLLDPIHDHEVEGAREQISIDRIYSELEIQNIQSAESSRKRKRRKASSVKVQPVMEESPNMYDILDKFAAQ